MKLIVDLDDEIYHRLKSEDYGAYQISMTLKAVKQSNVVTDDIKIIDANKLEDEFDMLEKVTNESSTIERAEHKMLMTCINMLRNAPEFGGGE